MIGCTSQPQYPIQPRHAAIAWQHNFDRALVMSEQSGKPVLIYFGSIHCNICTQMEKESLSTSDISNYINNSFIPIKINEHSSALMILSTRFNIQATPTFIVLTSADGKVLNRSRGKHNHMEFMLFLRASHSLNTIYSLTNTHKILNDLMESFGTR